MIYTLKSSLDEFNLLIVMLLWVLESLSSKFNCTNRKQTSDSWKNSVNISLNHADSISAATDCVSSLDYSQASSNLKSLKAYHRYLPRHVYAELSWANCIQKLILTCRRWLWVQTHWSVDFIQVYFLSEQPVWDFLEPRFQECKNQYIDIDRERELGIAWADLCLLSSIVPSFNILLFKGQIIP